MTKIVWESKGSGVPFEHLRMGETFALNDVLYLKIEPCKNRDGVVVNAISLADGRCVEHLYPESIVKPVNITITVEN